MTAAGYLITLGYVFFLILAVGTLVSRLFSVETSRKVIHLLLFAVWILIDYFFRNTVHQIVIPVIFLIVNTLSYKFRLFRNIERDSDNHGGTIFFAIAVGAILTAAYFIPALFPASGAAVFCLTFGDGAAALCGRGIPSPKIREHKTVAGFIGCFAVSAASLLVFRAVWMPELRVTDALLLAAVSAVAELTENGCDNFTVTFSVFGLAYLFTTSASDAIRPAVAWAVAVFLIVMFSRAIDYAGSLLSMGIVFAFRFCGGKAGLGYLLLTYFTIFTVALIRKAVLRGAEKKGESMRGFLQILINGGIGTACIVCSAFLPAAYFTALAVVAIGGCFIDSVSSDVGCMSRGEPYDPFRRKFVTKGLSGGMSVLGTSASLVFAAMISVYAVFVIRLPAAAGILTGVFAFFQTLLDSALGSLIQAKFECAVCGKTTEKKIHCGKPAVLRSGMRRIDNNAVNLISSAAVTGIAALCLKGLLWAL